LGHTLSALAAAAERRGGWAACVRLASQAAATRLAPVGLWGVPPAAATVQRAWQSGMATPGRGMARQKLELADTLLLKACGRGAVRRVARLHAQFSV
jgi:hypothetical protein